MVRRENGASPESILYQKEGREVLRGEQGSRYSYMPVMLSYSYLKTQQLHNHVN